MDFGIFRQLLAKLYFIFKANRQLFRAVRKRLQSTGHNQGHLRQQGADSQLR